MSALSRSHTALRALLMTGLLAGIYLIALLLFGLEALLLLPLVLALSHHGNKLMLDIANLFVAASVPGLTMIVYGVFATRRSADGPWIGVPLARAAAPALWRSIDEVAARVGTRPPNELYLAAAANASVNELPRLFGLRRGPRRLTVGLPLLLGLSEPELKAVLAHEMGHYARGHTRLGARVYLGSLSLRQISLVLGALRESERRNAAARIYWRFASIHTRIAYHLFSAYSGLYDAVSTSVRRREELDADAIAAAQYGTRATGGALRTLHTLPAAWEQFVSEVFDPMRRTGWVPDDPFSAFEAMLDDPRYKARLARLKQSPPHREPARHDSHPSLSQRLECLPDPEDANEPDLPALPAARMFTAAQRHHAGITLGRAMSLKSSAPTTRTTLLTLPWQRWLERATVYRVNARSTALLRSAERIGAENAHRTQGTPGATLDTVLSLLAAGRVSELEDALAESSGLAPTSKSPSPSPSPSKPDAELLADALAALVSRYVAGRVTASWQLSWTNSRCLVPANASAEQILSCSRAASRISDPRLDELRLLLTNAEVDAADAPPPTDEDWDEQRSRTATGARVHIPTVVDEALVNRQLRFRAAQIVLTGAVGVTALVALVIMDHSPDSNGSAYPYRGGHVILPTPYGGAGELTQPTPYAEQLTLPTPYARSAYPYMPLPSLFQLPTFPYTFVKIQPGDNLSVLACRYQTTVSTLQEINDMGSSTVLYAGHMLLVPDDPSGSPVESSGC